MATYEEFTYGELRWELQGATLLDIADKLTDISEMVDRKLTSGGGLPTRVKYDVQTSTLVVKF